ncbi:MAG TPA: DUF6318 family protein [Nocardioides sp.]|nr:DUF6318 family protein [Nocardioides sp.]
MLRLATAALAGILLLSGCSDDGPDAGDPMSTWTPTGTIESSSPSPTDPLTTAAQGETAREFIERWVALVDKMQQTGDTEAFLDLAGPDCRSCRRMADNVSQVYGDGGRIDTDGSRISRVQHDGGDQWSVTLVGSPTTVFDKDGKPSTRLPGGRYQLLAFIVKADGNWTMGEFQDKN